MLQLLQCCHGYIVVMVTIFYPAVSQEISAAEPFVVSRYVMLFQIGTSIQVIKIHSNSNKIYDYPIV